MLGVGCWVLDVSDFGLRISAALSPSIACCKKRAGDIVPGSYVQRSALPAVRSIPLHPEELSRRSARHRRGHYRRVSALPRHRRPGPEQRRRGLKDAARRPRPLQRHLARPDDRRLQHPDRFGRGGRRRKGERVNARRLNLHRSNCRERQVPRPRGDLQFISAIIRAPERDGRRLWPTQPHRRGGRV